MTEVFKEIKGYEKYEVSNLGRVRNSKTLRILKQGRTWNGYRTVTIYCNNIKKTRKVHQLVCVSFMNHDHCGFKLVVKHLNYDK